MDISHVASVEYPLVIKNTDKAIAMIGGKPRISSVINAEDKSSNPNYHTTTENTLELRLRSDPFHHPIQSSYSSNEKIVVKVSVPKSKLPSNYKENTILQNIQHAQSYTAQPIGIIDKTYSFKSVSDFQSCTKNNSTLKSIQKLYGASNYLDLQKQFKDYNELNDLKDHLEDDYYSSSNHNLPPPPIFSPIRFPYDYKYQKNPFTAVVRDEVSGEVKVVSTKSSVKIFNQMIDYNVNDVPQSIAPELIENLNHLTNNKLPRNSSDYNLFKCIEYLRKLFELKPIWLRKHLDDIVPEKLKKSIKPALPYISYIYQSGPWRFCNVKIGVNPQIDSSNWIYQCEYFRSSDSNVVIPPNTNRVKLNTISEESNITIGECLLFNGTNFPTTATYQIGDITDSDICTIIKDHQSAFGELFLRQSPDFQDGWINKQTMEVIRRIIRYKLQCLAKDDSADQNKIYKIINTDYTIEKNDEANEKEEEEEEAKDENKDEDGDITMDVGDITVDTEDREVKEETKILESLNEKILFDNINKADSGIANQLGNLVGFIKQDVIDQD